MKTLAHAILVVAIALISFAPVHSQDPEAVVRVLAGNSLGSGTVFYRSANGDAYVLTNHHVAGRKGSRVGVEFWEDGKLQKKVPGVVVEAAIDKGYTDVAIVRCTKADLGGLNPPFIPLAAPATNVAKETVISSRGCPDGVWQCQFVGRTNEADEKRMEFYPRPGGGRSGSSVLVSGKNEIAGLLTWSADKPNWESHGTDGMGYQSGYGIAQQIESVWKVIRGQVATTGEQLPDHYEPLVDHLIEPPVDDLAPDADGQESETADDGPLRKLLRRSPRDAPQPEPQPPPQFDTPLPQFEQPSPGPIAEPDIEPDQELPPDDDGLLRRRFGEPRAEPRPEDPNDDGLFFGRSPERVGPIRGAIQAVRGFFNVILWLLAAYGGFCLFMKLRGLMGTIAKAAAPLLLIALTIPIASAQEPRSIYAHELEGRAEIWKAEPASQVKRWTSYDEARKAALADKSRLLVLVTMPGCPACDTLKSQLKEADKFGWLNGTHTCIVDSAREPQLAAQFKPEAYPTLAAYSWDADSGNLRRTSIRTGAFGVKSARPEIIQGILNIELEVESLEEWLLAARIE